MYVYLSIYLFIDLSSLGLQLLLEECSGPRLKVGETATQSPEKPTPKIGGGGTQLYAAAWCPVAQAHAVMLMPSQHKCTRDSVALASIEKGLYMFAQTERQKLALLAD